MAWRALYLYAAAAAARAKTGTSSTSQFAIDSATRIVKGWVSARRGGLEVRLETLFGLETLKGRPWWHRWKCRG